MEAKKIKIASSFLLVVLICSCSLNSKHFITLDDLLRGDFLDFQHNNITREYIIHIPDELPKNPPMVLMLHHYYGRAEQVMWYLQMNEIAELNKFIVLYPQGLRDDYGVLHWNSGTTASQVDDIGFLEELTNFIQIQYSVDPDRIFVGGISNGGFMAYKLACEKTEIFKAMASVIGTMSKYSWDSCSPSRPISVLQISSLDDDVVPISGIELNEWGWGGAPEMDVIINFWKEFNQANNEHQNNINDYTQSFHYKDGINSSQVWYYKVDELGHDLPKENKHGINVADKFWEFFSQF